MHKEIVAFFGRHLLHFFYSLFSFPVIFALVRRQALFAYHKHRAEQLEHMAKAFGNEPLLVSADWVRFQHTADRYWKNSHHWQEEVESFARELLKRHGVSPLH